MTNVADPHLLDTGPGGALSSQQQISSRPAKPERTSSGFGTKLVLMAADAVTIAAAVVLSLAVRSVWWEVRVQERQYTVLALAALPVWIAILAYHRLYASRHVTRTLEEFRRIVASTVTGVMVLIALAFFLKIGDVSRGWLLIVFVASTTFLSIERAIVRKVFAGIRNKGGMLRPVVVVGGNLEGLELCHMLENDRGLGYEVRGFVDDEAPIRDTLHPQLGTLEQTLDAVRATKSTGVIIAATAMDLGTSNRLIRELTEHGIHVELSSTLRDIAAHRLTVRPLGRFPVVYVEPVQRGGWRAVAKRSFDLVLAGIGLLVAAPVLGVTAILIKLDSKGPVFFKQTRVGRDGDLFKVYKFRSMVTDAEARLLDLRDQNEADGPLFKMRNDPRVTRVGQVIRKFSIDEIPQLWNVMRGEMSMVGPRPALPKEVELWGEALHGRLRVKPGVTGMWQVSGRSDASFAEYERLDLYYVDNWSLTTDLAIVAKTVPTVLLRKGAF